MLGSSAQANAELPPQNRLNGIVNNLAKRIFNGERITYDPELLASTATTLLNAMTTGYGKSLSDVDYDTPDFNTLRKLTENVFQFSASKDFHILQDMTLALKDTDGKLRSFSDFQKEVDKMNLQYNGNWLRTEYNHAVAASQCAARWTEQVSRSQSMPYLQYQAVMDSNTRPEHAALNGVIKRIDSDFWDKYYPPNGWGCRCEVIQLPGKNHKETPDMDLKHCKVAPMFQVNVGKKGVIFPKGHPYFMGQCQRCKSQLGTPDLSKPQCQACTYGIEQCKKFIEDCKKNAESKKEWDNIDTGIWNKTKFYSESGGFIAAHKLKAPDYKKDKTGGVYGENAVNEMLAKIGKHIYRLPDNVSGDIPILGKPYRELLKYKEDGKVYGYPDDFFDGQTWDIKSIKTANENSIREHIRNGRKADNVIFFFNGDIEVNKFKEYVWNEIRYRQSKGKVQTLPNIYFINEKGNLIQYWNKKGGQ